MDERIKTVTRYQTPDGDLHRTPEIAEYCLFESDMLGTCNDMLNAGKSIADILRHADRKVPDEILEYVTKDTKLVISYWQCQDTAGYQPCRFLKGLVGMFVYGNAGCWSGPYGNDVKLSDLVRYAKATPGIGALSIGNKEAPNG